MNENDGPGAWGSAHGAGTLEQHSPDNMSVGEVPDLDDRGWFAAHHRRFHRVRPAFAGETVLGEQWPWIAVCQPAPGMRLRAGFDPSQELADDGEAFARAVFGEILEALADGRAELDPAAIARRARHFVRKRV